MSFHMMKNIYHTFTIKYGYLSYLYSVYLSVVLGEVPI